MVSCDRLVLLRYIIGGLIPSTDSLAISLIRFAYLDGILHVLGAQFIGRDGQSEETEFLL